MNPSTLQEVIIQLKDILNDKKDRYEKVSQFIYRVMPDNEEKYDDFIHELAYDLDFYDPRENLRKKYNFYGEEKLEKLLSSALKELETRASKNEKDE